MTEVHHRFVQSYKITNQALQAEKNIVNLPAFLPSPLFCQHENRALYLLYFLYFVNYLEPIANRPSYSAIVSGDFIKAHADKSKLKSTRESLGPTSALWDSFDPTLHLTGGHEEEKVVSIRMKQKMKRTQTYITLCH